MPLASLILIACLQYNAFSRFYALSSFYFKQVLGGGSVVVESLFIVAPIVCGGERRKSNLNLFANSFGAQ